MIVSRTPDPEAAPNLVGMPPTDPPVPSVQLFVLDQGLLAEHELVIAPGASAQDVSTALVLVPADAALVDFGGDTDLSIVFREVPRTRAARHDALTPEEA